jgi:Domain of unknown function (DUF4351)
VSAEIQAWFEDYQQKLRNEARKEGRSEGVRSVLLRVLHARFGELPAAIVARVEAAELADLELWSERVLDGARRPGARRSVRQPELSCVAPALAATAGSPRFWPAGRCVRCARTPPSRRLDDT